jgi:hypothetical protein
MYHDSSLTDIPPIMKLSEDTLVCLGEILAGKSDSHNSEINKLQHQHVRGVVLHHWYFLFSSRLALPLRSPPSFAAEEFPSDDSAAIHSNAFEVYILRMEGIDSEPIVAIQLAGSRPVATLIEAWGEPPAVLQQDWRQQLEEFDGPSEILFFFATDDGLLAKVPGTEHLEHKNGDFDPVNLDSAWKQVQWPWELSNVQPLFHRSRKEKETVKKQHLPQKLSLRLLGGSIAGLVLITIFIAMLWPFNRRGAKDLAKSTLNSAAIDSQGDRLNSNATDSKTKSNSQSDSAIAMDSSTIDPDSLEGTDLKKDTLDNTAELMALSEELTSLLGPGTNSDVILSSRIVETSLGTSTPMTLGNAIEPEATAEADVPMEPTADESKPDDGSIAPIDLEVGMERTILLTGATIKDRIAIGQKLLSKDGACTATLQLEPLDSKPVAIVGPEGMISIVGNGANAWTIGIEESDPELVLQLQSKPGRRWDLFVLVGFREEKTQPLRLLAPGNAKTVVNQLIVAKQSVLRMLEQNQLARDSGVRGGVDLYEQRRQLQRQEKELDKALERWKVIEKLSYLIFDHAKLQVTLKRTPSQ